jgi:hypothetical protein
MGVVSLFVMPLPLGLFAWFWANQDLRKMNAGRMDGEGRGATQAGKVCGMISSLLLFAASCCTGLYCLVPLAYIALVAPPDEHRPAWDGPKQAGAPAPEKREEDEARKRKQRDETEAAARARQEEAKRRADAEAERKAAEDEKKRRAAEAKKAAADEELASERLKYAKKLLDQGKDDLAKERLEKIVNESPNTKAAAEAKKLLEKMSQ